MRKSVPVLIKRSSTSDACDCDPNLAASGISDNCQPKMMKIGSHFETRQRLIRSNQRNKDRLFGDQASMYLPPCLTPHSIGFLPQSFGSQPSIFYKYDEESNGFIQHDLYQILVFILQPLQNMKVHHFFKKKNVLYFMHSKNYLDFRYSVIKFLHFMFFNDYKINGLETSLSTKL